jgi:hypothetical protein
MNDLRWMLVAGIYLVWIMNGAVLALTADVGAAWILSVSAAALVVTWCIVDARRRGHPLVPMAQKLLLLNWPVGGPLYLVWSRSWWGLWLSLLHFFGYWVALFLGIIVAMLAS